MKRNIIYVLLTALLASTIFFTLGKNSVMVEAEDNVMTYNEFLEEYEELIEEITSKESELEEIVEAKNEAWIEYEELEETIESKREAIDEALDIYERREQVEEEIKEQNSQVEELKAEVSSLEDEIASLTGELKKKESEPISLAAGHFVVGSDIQPARYVAEADGGSGNFVVYSSDGSVKVNTILGEGRHREKEFVFYANEGDILDLSTRIKFTEVE
ncbi:peptidoglycan bridge formation glycyltransferase FemA/FemB family protein [Halalkalibacterium halodurans]|uniref:peptidoglycan bridge formation glycyltransferase FemA/FemB family protein n=1 Tax=Halalkalibacterium halodurans TaxID=86665 RepID=UPI0006A9F074|nr:peptidoglycan bridge formation glycyltransferase FemA/FemB family protein [Halalkalibacterium halodurans]TPE68010.1 hypothetical protein AMD02_015730 [Halalkalibacterium halodurans]